MEGVTIIIQGRITQETFDFYVKNYKGWDVIISTWIGLNIDYSELPDGFTLLISKLPNESGFQNLNYQLVSTLNGLTRTKNPYIIKVRGDEKWSNLENVGKLIKSQPKKLWCSSVFFRPWVYINYHVSDHIIAGTLENLLIMFQSTKYNFENELIYYIKNGEKMLYWEPEIMLTRSYIKAKAPQRYEKVDGRILMAEYFDIIDIDLLKPFFIKANAFKTAYTEFVPERNFSISTIEQLFSDDPYKIPNKK
jgi:hypothetical protein